MECQWIPPISSWFTIEVHQRCLRCVPETIRHKSLFWHWTSLPKNHIFQARFSVGGYVEASGTVQVTITEQTPEGANYIRIHQACVHQLQTAPCSRYMNGVPPSLYLFVFVFVICFVCFFICYICFYIFLRSVWTGFLSSVLYVDVNWGKSLDIVHYSNVLMHRSFSKNNVFELHFKTS